MTDLRELERMADLAAGGDAAGRRGGVGRLRSQAGLTITEVVVVLSVIGLLAAATYQFTMTGSTVGLSCIDNIPPGNICPANRTPDMTEALPSDVTITPSPLTLGFDAGGGVPPATFTITYGSSPNYQVAINAAGRVRVCSPMCP